jgi:hypothetical protein
MVAIRNDMLRDALLVVNSNYCRERPPGAVLSPTRIPLRKARGCDDPILFYRGSSATWGVMPQSPHRLLAEKWWDIQYNREGYPGIS